MAILGKDMVLRRLQSAWETLAGQGFTIKGKELKRMEAAYEAAYK